MLPLILGLAAAGSGKYVKVLDSSNFDSTVESKEYDVVIVEFYAPWCGHCKHLEPEWAKAAEELHNLGKRIALANVDATAHEALGQRFEVRGYPTLKIFRGDPAKPEEYDGPRDAPGIVKYALDLLAPAVDVVDSEDALQKVIAENTAQGRRTVVAYADDGSAEASAHETAAKANRKYFRFARAPAAAKPANTGDFGIVGSGDEATWQTGGSVADLVADNKFALVAEISQNNYADYVNRGLPIVWAFVNQADASKLAAEIAELDKVAKPHKGKVSVVYLDGGKYGGMAARMGLTGTTTPSVAVENAEKAHWSYDESAKWDGEKIAEWLGRVLSGDITPTVKSEPKPADPVDEAGVTTLVGDTFAEIVGDAAKDVLVEFYAPWCGHCKHLAPIYAELGTLVKNTCGSSSEVVIAKMDATANDVPLPGFQVSGYPTIYFAPAAAGATPITFEGERTVDGFASFLAKKGKTACAGKLAKASDEL